MAEVNAKTGKRIRRVHHRGRTSQVLIYLGKQFRFFINENDWKVLPMAVIIAGLVGMVIRGRLFVNMEGSLIGGFSLTCVAIWNGCFNSIQAVCRERAIIKREHRSGMHISSYVAAHMIYQLLLCLAQTGLTMYVLVVLQVPFPAKGFMTKWMVVDIGITMFLITYASDMMSLFLSSISHTTTGAMTLMPFVLIFQLVFSGGVIPLPAWSQSLSNFTISNYGLKAIVAQSGYNELPMITGWTTLKGMTDKEVGGTVTVGQIMDILNSPGTGKFRDREILPAMKIEQIGNAVLRELGMSETAGDAAGETAAEKPENMTEQTAAALPEAAENGIQPAAEAAGPPEEGSPAEPGENSGKPAGVTAEEQLPAEASEAGPQPEAEAAGAAEAQAPAQTAETGGETASAESFIDEEGRTRPVTLGQVIDLLNGSTFIRDHRDYPFTFKATVGDLMEIVGTEKVKEVVEKTTAEASYNKDYAKTEENIIGYWFMLGLFILFFACISVLALEMIDRDKR